MTSLRDALPRCPAGDYPEIEEAARALSYLTTGGSPRADGRVSIHAADLDAAVSRVTDAVADVLTALDQQDDVRSRLGGLPVYPDPDGHGLVIRLADLLPVRPDDAPPVVVPAVLGWSNPDTGPENLRLYATDRGNAPRWVRPHARVVEQALRETAATGEGDRYLVIRLGTRFLSDDAAAAAALAVIAVISGQEPAADV